MKVRLTYLPWVLVLVAWDCNIKDKKIAEQAPVLFPDPVTVPANPQGGYVMNLVSGEPVKLVLHSNGDTLVGGRSMPMAGHIAVQEKDLHPRMVKAGPGTSYAVRNHTVQVPEQIRVHYPDRAKLRRIPFGKGDITFQLRNHMGEIPSGVPVPCTPRVTSFIQPRPQKTLPLRYKDRATENIQYLDAEQGLPSSYVYAVKEDRRGNLWFATDGAGVCRYDGVNLTNYTEKEGLTDNVVNCIYEDKKGDLWFGTPSGVSIYDGVHFLQITEDQGLASNLVLDISGDARGGTWISTDNGACRYDGKTLTHFTMKEGLPGNSVRCTLEDRQGNLWFGTDSGLSKFDGKVFTQFTAKDGLCGNNIFCMTGTRDGRLWVGTLGSGISCLDGEKIVSYTTREGLSLNYVWSLLEDRKGNIWASTYEGLNIFDGKSFTHFTEQEGLSNISVRKLAEDRSGNIWWGTDGGGINKFRGDGFVNLSGHEILTKNRSRAIMQDGTGNFWFGTNGTGVLKYDGHNITCFTSRDGLTSNGARDIVEDNNRNLWFVTEGFGINRYDGKYFTSYSMAEGLPGDNIKTGLKDRSGNLWFGIYDGGLAKYDGHVFTQYTEKEGLAGNKVLSLLEDRAGNIWIGTDGSGLSRFDGQHITHFTEKEGLPSNKIYALAIDHLGRIWIGTAGGGACVYDGKTFTYVTEKEGLSNNNVWSIMEDKKGQVWLGTDNGLTLMAIRDSGNKTDSAKGAYRIYTYGMADGLKSADFNMMTVFSDKRNTTWWGTGKGIVYLEEGDSHPPSDSVTLQLNDIEINDRFIDYRHMQNIPGKGISAGAVPAYRNYPDQLVLPHSQNHITFRFAAIEWAAPHHIKYVFRMKGLDNGWSEPDENPVAEFRNLDYGNYQLEVMAVGHSQVWSRPFVYSFTVLPAWWQTWWFRTLFVLFIAAIVYGITRYVYANKLRQQRARLEKHLAIQHERQRISGEMHDDIGAGLSGVRLITEMARSRLSDEVSRNELDKIYQSVSAIGGKMKEVIWSLNLENDNLESLILFIQKQSRQLMEAYSGHFTIDMPAHIPDCEVEGESRRDIYLSVKEALHNVIKHSLAGEVKLSMACDKNLVITISDNGRGFSNPDAIRLGNGLKNMRSRMQKLGGHIHLNSKDGTTVIFTIPLNKTI